MKKFYFSALCIALLLIVTQHSFAQVDMVLQAFPPNGGSITVNGTPYNTYPTTIQVPTASATNATATANPGFKFVQWHLVYHAPLPDDITNPMSFTATQKDTIYAFFQQLPPDSFNIQIKIMPNNLAGNVIAGGKNSAVYPWTGRFAENDFINFEATGNSITTPNHVINYVFDHYEFNHHVPQPSSTQPIVFIHVDAADTVTAFFVEGPPQQDSSLHLLVPSAFSPDENGVNDIFRTVGEHMDKFHMEIFDRWGQRVFESDNQGYGWNGQFNNEKCPMGAYVYFLSGKRLNGDEVRMKGTVTLVR